MKADTVIDKFEQIGAGAVVSQPSRPHILLPRDYQTRNQRRQHIEVNVHGSTFTIQVGAKVAVDVLDCRPTEKHLLLRAKTGENEFRFLCGHDERHWFTAAVGRHSKTVDDAMESLKPKAVLEAQHREHLTRAERQTRHNRAYLRQGEWFFIPDPKGPPSYATLLKHEPIQRGRSKPHYCEELARVGGTRVYINSANPNGLTPAERDEYMKNWVAPPGQARAYEHMQQSWRMMVRDAAVYARGAVTHPDHATLDLKGWHRVYMNEESKMPGGQHMAFLD